MGKADLAQGSTLQTACSSGLKATTHWHSWYLGQVLHNLGAISASLTRKSNMLKRPPALIELQSEEVCAALPKGCCFKDKVDVIMKPIRGLID